MRLKKILAGFFLFFCCSSAVAQSNECELTLSQATDEFNAGHFYEIPALLKPCLDRSDFTNEQRVRAYLLLSQVYLIVDDPIAAEDSYLKLLRADPEYIATKEKDPIDVVYLSSKFTTRPIFTPHLRLGANASFARKIIDISTSPYPFKNKNTIRPGFQFGAGLDWNLTDNISFCADVIAAYKSFKTATPVFNGAGDVTSSKEKQIWLDVPLYFKFTDSKGQIRPYGYVGYAANFLFGSTGTLELNNKSTTGTGAQETQSTVDSQGPDVKFKFNRNMFNRSFVIGGGVRYKIGKDYLFADLRYMGGMSNVTGTKIYSPANQDSGDPITSTNLTTYSSVSSYFRVDNVSLSFGYVRPIYNPRKIKRARTKGVMRKIEKEKSNEGQ
jgi:hypothetical protein